MIDTVVFYLGKVLLDWSPGYFYRSHFADDEPALERFLSDVVSPEWIAEMDAGKPIADAIAERCSRHPDHAELIALWRDGWTTMLRGEIAGSVAILAELRERGTRLYSITNFSTETYPHACERFEFLHWFEHTVVSGELGIVKPDRRIFDYAIGRCGLDPATSVFIDDMPANIAAARASGFHAIHFTSPADLRSSLVSLGLL